MVNTSFAGTSVTRLRTSCQASKENAFTGTIADNLSD